MYMMQVERTTNHDVKAIEYVLKDRFKSCAELNQVPVTVANLSLYKESSELVLYW